MANGPQGPYKRKPQLAGISGTCKVARQSEGVAQAERQPFSQPDRGQAVFF